MKITVLARWNEHCVQIEFPCDDGYLTEHLRQIGVFNPLDDRHIIEDINSDVSTLLVLKGKYVDLDKLNYLAKHLDSFDKHELAQFEAAMLIKGYTEMKDMINLTFNLQNFTVVTDFTDLEKIGKNHYLTVNGCYAGGESTDFKSVGFNLLNGGKGVVTPYGVLYENDLPYNEVFDGRTFPEYYYQECALCSAITYDDRIEYLYLPCDDEAIVKAAGRLGAERVEDCEIDHITPWNMSLERLESIDYAYDRVDIRELNDFIKSVLDFTDKDFEKLTAVCAYAGAEGFPSGAKIAENLDAFVYIPDINSLENLGKYLIKKSGEYQYDKELDDFYNYESFGAFICKDQNGEFIEYGYVGINEYITLAEILGQYDMKIGSME